MHGVGATPFVGQETDLDGLYFPLSLSLSCSLFFFECVIMATTTAKAKRFSFAGFFSKKQEPSSPITQQQHQPPPSTDNNTATQEKKQQRRAQKTQSLYIQSFRHRFSTPSSKPTCSQYDPSEVQQSNPKEIRNTIRRSLSAVMYATPQKQREEVATTTTTQEKNNTSSSSEPGKLVPILVTEGLFDQHSGMIVSAEPETLPTEKRRVPVEYDNTLDVLDNKDGTSLVVWQGYGYVIKEEEPKTEDKEEQENDHASSSSLTWSFDKEVWSEYRGLIHPLHLVQEDNDDRWKALTVTELKRYYDNYGSMLLRLREACMKRQQTQYLAMEGKAKTEWLIPHA